jgi:hypothetical protein
MQEIVFIHSLAMKMGLNEIEFKLVVEQPDRTTFKIPYDEEIKMQHFFQSLALMNIDFVAHPAEIKFCLELGRQLQIPSYKCGIMIDFMVSSIGSIVDYEDFRQSLNN